jgi:tripartite-type tricarboxylate transporter receptor subunit TctC
LHHAQQEFGAEIKNIPEVIAQSNPGKINMATSGPGSSPDIYGALFKKLAGVSLVPVAYIAAPGQQ